MRRCNTEPSLRPGSQFKKKAYNVVINGIKIFFQKLTTQTLMAESHKSYKTLCECVYQTSADVV